MVDTLDWLRFQSGCLRRDSTQHLLSPHFLAKTHRLVLRWDAWKENFKNWVCNWCVETSLKVFSESLPAFLELLRVLWSGCAKSKSVGDPFGKPRFPISDAQKSEQEDRCAVLWSFNCDALRVHC